MSQTLSKQYTPYKYWSISLSLTSFIHLLFVKCQSPIYSSLSRAPSDISKFNYIHRQRSGFLQQIAKQILTRILKPSVPIHVLNFQDTGWNYHKPLKFRKAWLQNSHQMASEFILEWKKDLTLDTKIKLINFRYPRLLPIASHYYIKCQAPIYSSLSTAPVTHFKIHWHIYTDGQAFHLR